MDNPRPEKVAVVTEVRERLDAAEAVVLTEYRGLSVRAMANLRRALRDAGGEYKVYKNTMVRFAAKDLELEIDDLLVGPTALAFTGTRPDGSAGDAVTVAKALTEFGRTNDKLVIKGGLLDGRPLTADDVVALSKIAPREELLARLAGGFAAPMSKFAALLNAVPQKFAYALSALIEAGGAPGAPAAASPAAAETDDAAEATVETAGAETDDAAEATVETAGAETDDAAEATVETAEADPAADADEADDEATAETEAAHDAAADSDDDPQMSGDTSEEQES